MLRVAGAFPRDAQADFKAIARELEWKSDSPQPVYQSSFVVWPTAEGLILARLRDSGQDDRGRPHALRIEAAFIADGSKPPIDPEAVASMLDDSAWPSGSWDCEAASCIELRRGPGRQHPACELLRRFVARHNRYPRLLYTGGHLKFDDERYEAIFIDGDQRKPRVPTGAGETLGPGGTPSEGIHAGSTARRWYVVLGVCVLLAIGFVWISLRAVLLRREVADRDSQLASLKAERDRDRTRADELQRANHLQVEENMSLKYQNTSLSRDLSEIREQNRLLASTKSVNVQDLNKLLSEKRRRDKGLEHLEALVKAQSDALLLELRRLRQDDSIGAEQRAGLGKERSHP
jgi:hypothetical protein